MSGKERSIASDLDKVDAHVITPEEYEEIPELDDDFFERADYYEGGKLVRRGRPARSTRRCRSASGCPRTCSPASKQAVPAGSRASTRP